MLSNDEFVHVSSMLCKGDASGFSDDEAKLCKKLKDEKQFIDDPQRKDIEEQMLKSGYFETANKRKNDFICSIQLTQDCNMRCAFCFERGYADKQARMSEEKIDAVFDFFKSYGDAHGITMSPSSSIRITGGEPLLNQQYVDMINYIANKWPDAKIILFTNGSNLTKFYNQLPISRFDSVDIALDGIEENHLLSRRPDASVSKSFYGDIITGIKQLLKDQVTVNIKTVVSKENYMHFPGFVQFLNSEGILSSPNATFVAGLVMDCSNPLEIDEAFNNKQDALRIQSYIQEKCGFSISTFPSASALWGILQRTDNNPYMPRSVRCGTSFLINYYFSPNGNIYFCDCMDKDKAVVGTYYPEISIDEDIVKKLAERDVMTHAKCKECPYKFVCLGGCPLGSLIKDEEMSCGIFADQEILDNLEYPYYEKHIAAANYHKET